MVFPRVITAGLLALHAFALPVAGTGSKYDHMQTSKSWGPFELRITSYNPTYNPRLIEEIFPFDNKALVAKFSMRWDLWLEETTIIALQEDGDRKRSIRIGFKETVVSRLYMSQQDAMEMVRNMLKLKIEERIYLKSQDLDAILYHHSSDVLGNRERIKLGDLSLSIQQDPSQETIRIHKESEARPNGVWP